MKFKYKQLSTTIARPIIPIEIGYKNNTMRYEALVDSGADQCLFGSTAAELLGIHLTKGRAATVVGISGVPQTQHLHKVTLTAGGWKHEIEAGFLEGKNTSGLSLLGQRGFFEFFIVRFDYSKLEVEINPKRR